MSNALAKLYTAILLPVIAVLLTAGIASAQRTGDAGAETYQIDSRQSDLRLLVYRGGVLSTFGHNHVVSARDFKGTIHLRPGLERSRVELEIPVDRLVVDDPELRRQEGKGFASQPSKDDIEGTRANMLGDELLQAKKFSTIRIAGTTGPVSDKNSAMLNLTVELLGRSIKLSLPAKLKREGDQLEASGTVSLSHEQLGLKPFTALMGALRVADKMDFKYRIRAARQPQ